MNISSLVLDYLTENEKVSVSGFGDFVLENTGAVLNPEQKTLLPPAKKVVYFPNYEVENDDFINFVATQKNISRESASQEIKAQVIFWKNKINEGENFSIEPLGEFKISADSVVFNGSRISANRSDFYGLEEIDLNDLRKKQTVSSETAAGTSGNSYRFNRSFLWIFLLAIPVAGLAYFGITQPELVFGKKSFDEASLKNPPQKVKPVPVTKDSLNLARLDSLKTDSLNKAALLPLKKSPAKKTWKSKKYPTKKWRKPKKRVNRSQ